MNQSKPIVVLMCPQPDCGGRVLFDGFEYRCVFCARDYSLAQLLPTRRADVGAAA